MKASELVCELGSYINRFGDKEVKLNLLTENGSYNFPINSAFESCEADHLFEISYEIDNVKEFKKGIR